MTPGYDLAAVRRELPLLETYTYLNTAYMGIVAEPVLARYVERLLDYERGGTTRRPYALDEFERARAAAAAYIGGEPDELTLNRNASDGINLIAAGFRLQPGDEVVMSSEENQAMLPPWLVSCQRSGARLRFFTLSHEPDEFRANLKAVVNERTRLVICSHVSCESGRRAPVHLIRELVGPAVSVLIDTAQSVGQLPIEVRAFKADFVISNGHKWICAPKGVGFTWIARESLELVEPEFFDESALARDWLRAYYQIDPPPAARFKQDAARYEYGTRSHYTTAVLADALSYLDALGWEAVSAHICAMATELKQRLAEIPGVTVVTPLEWESSSGIVVFSIAGRSGAELRFQLRDEERIETRIVEMPSAVRASCAYFTAPEDVNHLVRTVARIAAAA